MVDKVTLLHYPQLESLTQVAAEVEKGIMGHLTLELLAVQALLLYVIHLIYFLLHQQLDHQKHTQ